MHIKSKKNGFSLMELMVTVTIIGVLAVMAAPSIGDVVDKSKIKSIAYGVNNGFQEARSEALKRNKNIRVDFDADGYSLYEGDNLIRSVPVLANTAGSGINVDVEPDDSNSVVFTNIGTLSNKNNNLTKVSISKDGVNFALNVLIYNGGGTRICLAGTEKAGKYSSTEVC